MYCPDDNCPCHSMKSAEDLNASWDHFAQNASKWYDTYCFINSLPLQNNY